MFVQDDVIFKCGFLKNKQKKNSGILSGLQHALLSLQAISLAVGRRLFEQTGSETKVNKSFWPFGVKGVLKVDFSRK